MTGAKEAAESTDRLVSQTADVTLLSLPLRSLADIESIERTPLSERLAVANFCERVDLAIAARDPDETAIYFVTDGDVDRPAEEVSFRDIRRNIDRTAALLRAHGIGRNDVVAVLMPAVPAIYWSLLGAMSAGIAFPVNWMMEPKQILHLLKESKTKAIITLGPTPEFKIWESIMSIASELPQDIPIWSVAAPNGSILPKSDLDTALSLQPDNWRADPISGDDIVAYVHSGGTTGAPKIVKLSHYGMSYRHWTMQTAMRLTIGEVSIHDTPMFHVGGLIGRVLAAFASGASMIIPSMIGARDRRYISNYWKFVEKYRISRLSAVPTTLAVLCKAPPTGEDLSSLKEYFATGSTALPLSVRDEFQRVSGVTENTSAIAIDPRDGAPKEGSSGIRMPYTKVRSADMDGAGKTLRICGPDEIGMLQVSGPGVTPGYVNSAHERGARTEDGWIISGDLGRIDADGYIFVTGRAKDVIIRGGHNIDPTLIEEPLSQSPDVMLAAAVGKPDAHAGELPVAYVQLVPGSRVTSADLAEFLQGRIGERAAFPKDIFIIDKLPLTDVGKPLKNALRQDAAERVFRSVLSDATGLSTADGSLSVSVRPHVTSGTVATISIACPVEKQDELESRIKGVMGQYSIAHDIEWMREDGPLGAINR
jgi:fatty-acyl-CoA synthase